MFVRSFRLRLLIGVVLGAMGLLAITHLATVLFLHQYRVVLHGRSAAVIAAIALAALVFGLAQIRRGLSPFDRLRARLSAVRDGGDRRIEGSYPTEIQPLVNDLNGLLEHREGIVRRAVAKAGDLAHGLKTPLALLAQEADRAERNGDGDSAVSIRQQVEKMRRQIDYHLAHARAAGSGAAPGARASVAASAEGLARTLARLHADRALAIRVDVPADHVFRGEIEDLDEMLGNLLDNACKWAKSAVAISSSREEAALVITVDDDGPGLPPSLWEEVLRRGVRADEAAPGSGFGLAIVRDL
ncbi:MAG: ATP-binding protein, partial [Acidobacteriota bacterium]